MPICVHCNGLVPYVYKVYTSKSNIRLAVCDRCYLFADPLIEYPFVLLLIDLILLKPRVYRHLVFNRGSEPYQAGRKSALKGDQAEKSDEVLVDGEMGGGEAVDEERRVTEVNHNRRDVTWRSIFLLAVITMSVEILVLYSTMSSQTSNAVRPPHTSTTERRLWGYSALIVLICKFSAPRTSIREADFQLVATFAQHLTSTAITAGFLKISNPRGIDSPVRKLGSLNARRSLQRDRSTPPIDADLEPVDESQSSTTDRNTAADGRGVYFTLPMVSLTLFFSSLLPCLLHACLFIWSENVPGDGHPDTPVINPQEQGIPQSKLASILITCVDKLATRISPTPVHEIHLAWRSIAALMQREGINEMWIVVRLLAGMSSGFGLRVVLPGPPWQASVAVLGGWLVKTAIQTGLHAYFLA